MATAFDVDALLESTANDIAARSSSNHAEAPEPQLTDRTDRHERDRTGSRDLDGSKKRRERSRERRTDKDADTDEGRRSGGRRSRSRDNDRRRPRRDHGRDRHDRKSGEPDEYRPSGDYYRGSGRARTRSPDDERYYRPDRRERSPRPRRDDDREKRRDDRDRDRERGGRSGRGRDARRRTPSPKNSKAGTPEPTEDERDRRTVFVQQLAARLRTKDLIQFFEKVGPVKEAQIVKDRVSGRSKGVGYVEFKNEDSVPLAIAMTGQKLLGIPIIAQLTEAEKNRQARNTENGQSSANSGVPFHRLYVGNIHFSITEQDLQTVFVPFGELEFVQLQKEEQGRSRGYGFVQFRDPASAKEALEKMNGFDLAGRPIRVGLGNDKFTAESTANLMARFQGQSQANFQGSAFSGSGGRGSGGGDRANARDEKGTGGASALDDTDVGGVNFSNYSRDALMRKLARTDDADSKPQPQARKPVAQQAPVNMPQASRCVVLKNMFDPQEEEERSGPTWVKELEEETRDECSEKYGKVVHLAIDPSISGDIYVKFDTVSSGERAIQGLNGRFFSGRMITAQPVVDAVYNSTFPKAKNL